MEGGIVREKNYPVEYVREMSGSLTIMGSVGLDNPKNLQEIPHKH